MPPALPDAARLDNGAPEGLSTAQALQRLAAHGPNALEEGERRSWASTAREMVREPMLLLLMACAALYFLLGELPEALALTLSVAVVMLITLVQQRRTERALDALRNLASPQARVMRDGTVSRIDARQLVPGDLMLLAEGDRVPADGVLLQSETLTVDESLLTGESMPVDKRARPASGTPEAMPPLSAHDSACVYAGSLLVQGQGRALVLATGARSEIGRIGQALGTIDTASTPLQQATRHVVQRIASAVLAAALLVVAVLGWTRGDWTEAMLAGIAWAMALLPEEIPVVMAIFLALGAWRISRHKVLARRMPVLEALGAATVLCVDKTGTLTENRMEVARVIVRRADGFPRSVDAASAIAEGDADEELRRTLHVAALASRALGTDPMDRAITTHAARLAVGAENAGELCHEYPLRPDLLAVTRAWRRPEDEAFTVACKGAPETVAALCGLAGRPDWAAWQDELSRLTGQGLRVLGVAYATWPVGRPLPGSVQSFPLAFQGLVALADPLRPEVPQAVAECRAAGIRVIMITGDHAGTAMSIAQQAGLDAEGGCLTGAELQALDDAALRERVRTLHVIARAMPAVKLRVVQALQANGEVVAMTGDGVNDAPALKAADIGVAMGGRGTDVAREAADLIVTDDRFSSIVHAVRLGRRIFANLTRAAGYVVSVHIPIAGLSMLPVALGGPLMLLPVHVALLELLIDPACSIAFEAEPEEPDLMRRPPRSGRLSLFGAAGAWPWVLRGLMVLATTLAAYGLARMQGLDEALTRTAAFGTLLMGNAALIIAHLLRGRLTHNPAMWLAAAAPLASLALILAVAPARQLFRLSPVDHNVLAVGAALAGSLLAALWALPLAERRPVRL